MYFRKAGSLVRRNVRRGLSLSGMLRVFGFYGRRMVVLCVREERRWFVDFVLGRVIDKRVISVCKFMRGL